jgi:hypothetical protein
LLENSDDEIINAAQYASRLLKIARESIENADKINEEGS